MTWQITQQYKKNNKMTWQITQWAAKCDFFLFFIYEYYTCFKDKKNACFYGAIFFKIMSCVKVMDVWKKWGETWNIETLPILLPLLILREWHMS